MSDNLDGVKDLKRKGIHGDHDDSSYHSEKKRHKKESKTPKARPKHYPLSERQQLALLKQMTAEENNEQAATPTSTVKKTPGSSGRKDKVNKRNERGETPLHLATIRGELPLIIDLVKQGADINVQDYAGWTPLHEACNHGYQDIAKFLLEAGASVNSKGLDNDYPLHDAVTNEHVDLVELLLKHGANPLLANKNGERPLDMTDNEEIKRLMQNEVISSDESDRTASPLTLETKLSEKRKSKTRLNSESDQSEQSKSNSKALTSTASRELFKKIDKQNEKQVLTSSDSDDSDDVPLIRQRKDSTQSSSMPLHSSSSRDSASLPSSRTGSLSGNLFEKKGQKRLHSTESYNSADSEVKTPRSQRQSVDFNQRRKQSVSSEDEIPRAVQETSSKNKSLTDRSEESRASSLPKKPTVTITSSKLEQSDVYDFSPTADDFSMESDGISLKPDNRLFPKWESGASLMKPSKQTSLFSRKPQSIFSSTKGFDFNAKKSRKTSWDSVKPSDADIEKDLGEKTVIIKPVLHETSEMMFDRLFKSPKKEVSGFFGFEGKTRATLLSPKHTPSTTISNIITTTVTTFSRTGAIPVTSVFSGNPDFPPKVERTKTFAPSLLFSSGSYDVNGVNATSSRSDVVPTAKPLPVSSKIYMQGDMTKTAFSESVDKVSKGGKLVIEASKRIDKTVVKIVPSTPNLDSAKSETSRSLSLDTGSRVEFKKKVEPEKPLKIETPVENKAVKKIIMTEVKEKLSKTVSDPIKKMQTKLVTKDPKPVGESRKSVPGTVKSVVQTPPKKETKSDPKKATHLLLDSNSNFINDIENVSRQRHQEKLKRKKLILKKGKSSPIVKLEEKKLGKKSEVKLLNTDSWLGSPAERNSAERQKKLQQRSAKKSSDASLEQSTVQDDRLLSSIPQTEAPVSQPLTVLSPSKMSQPDFESQHLTKVDISKPVTFLDAEIASSKAVIPKPTQYPPIQTSQTLISPDVQTKFSPVTSPRQIISKGFASPNQGYVTPERILSPQLNQLSGERSAFMTPPPFHHLSSKQPPLQNTFQSPHQGDQNSLPSSAELQSNFGPSLNEGSIAAVTQGQPSLLEDPPGGTPQGTVAADQAATCTPAGSSSSSDVPVHPALPVAPDTTDLRQTTVEGIQNETVESSAKSAVDDPSANVPNTSDHVENNENSKPPEVESVTEEEKMLQEYIKQRLSLATIRIERGRRKRLPVYIPLHELMEKKKDPAVDKLNVYEERVAIQKKMFEKRKKITTVVPEAPQYYWEYMTFTGGYLLNGSKESRLSVPVLAPPAFLCEPMVELFNAHEERRVRLRVQHAIQREKLIISCEQEIMRVHSRAARTTQNQQIPFSACSMLMDNEVYNMPRPSNDNDTGKASIRDRFNSRMYLSWLQDVDDKYDKMKSVLLARQKHEAEAMFAVQKTEWIMKRQELDHSQRALKANEINEVYVPMVNIADDFDLLPA